MALENEQDLSNRRNVPRFFVEHPHISWMLLAGVLIWGYFGYTSMPQRKDPDIPVRLGVAACPWPGATAPQVDSLLPVALRRSRQRIRPFIRGPKRTTVLSPYLFQAIRL